MNQNPVSDFDIRRVVVKFKRERLRIRDDPRMNQRPKTFPSRLGSAVVEQIRDVLIRNPPLPRG